MHTIATAAQAREAALEAHGRAYKAWCAAKARFDKTRSRSAHLALWAANEALEDATEAANDAQAQLEGLYRRQEALQRRAAVQAWRSSQGLQGDLFSA